MRWSLHPRRRLYLSMKSWLCWGCIDKVATNVRTSFTSRSLTMQKFVGIPVYCHAYSPPSLDEKNRMSAYNPRKVLTFPQLLRQNHQISSSFVIHYGKIVAISLDLIEFQTQEANLIVVFDRKGYRGIASGSVRYRLYIKIDRYVKAYHFPFNR